MPYRGEPYRGEIGGPITGLSALAVLSIVLYHYNTGVPGGFVGIDVAFVIAGFLIASSIRSAIEAGSFSFLSFYERGVRRLLPALFVMLAVVLLASYLLQQPADFRHTAMSGAFAALSAGNVFFFLDSPYFNPHTAELPLLHTWPLAVVAQTFIALPLMIVAMRKAPPWLILAAIAALAALSFVFSNWYLGKSQTGGFYLMPSRVWELLAGSMLAYAPRLKLSPVIAGAIGVGGIAMILFAVATYNASMFYPGKKALLPVIGAMAVIYSSSSGGIAAKALAWKPVAFVGEISFSWFLWHWPLIAFYKYLGLNDGALTPKLLLMAVSFALAVASWRFVERPLRQPNPDGAPFGAVLIGICASIAIADAFGFAALTHVLPSRPDGAVIALHRPGAN
ncbi:MAG TPA: acyltransferase [Hyphomonadaceae bacterium]|jgi:peptidoglycan/LPS O-acetylase OafA/YrhL|nr:acyltransferase [Hyphomonadaceae bacterium]